MQYIILRGSEKNYLQIAIFRKRKTIPKR